MKSMANKYVKVIKRTQPDGPYYICGYSFGGLVAWEIAKQLVEQGNKVDGLYLIEAPAPLSKLVRPIVSLDEATNNKMWEDDIRQLLKDVFLNVNNGNDKEEEEEEEEDPRTDELKQKIRKLATLMYNYTDDISSNNNDIPIHYWRAKDFAEKTSNLLLDHPLFNEPYFGWERYQGNIKFHRPIPGNHYTILREEISGRLAKEIDMHMPHNSKRSSMDLKPLMLENVATTPSSRSSSAPTSATSRTSSSSAFPLFRTGNNGTMSKREVAKMAMNIQIPLPIVLVGMVVCAWLYSNATILL